MKQLILAIILVIILPLCAFEMDTLVDAPTAGMLQAGQTDIFTEFYKDNGLLLGVRVGIIPRVMIGVSYGSENVVGNNEPEWHDQVEFYGKFRLMDETSRIPALAIGYDSQGHGRFYAEDDDGVDVRRYDIKSKGFFGVLTKNFGFLGNLGLHLGTNYSLENTEDDRHMNIFTGVDKSIGDIMVLSVEYDMGINEDEKWLETIMDEDIEYFDKGYLNSGLGIYFSENLYLQVKFNDLLGNRGDTSMADRSIRLKYYFEINAKN
ncbi:MAG: YjbH domain-containing protein [Candidatus Cloacimonetes bacterium]|nr:YjbH domain-containing protein [Candidatus Cloacimonadota bacterium]